MLMILCYARRPLTVAELTDGVAVELGDVPRFNPKRKVKDVSSIQQICPGLVEIDAESPTQSIVRIAHFSVREYLESQRILDSKDAALFSIRRE